MIPDSAYTLGFLSILSGYIADASATPKPALKKSKLKKADPPPTLLI